MTSQAQCPNCGGYKVTAERFNVKQVISIPLRNRLIYAGVLLLLSFTAMGISLVIGEDWSIICGGFFAFWWFVAAFIALFRSKLKKVVGKAYEYTCLICGYRWEWQEGQPWPKANINPDLLAMGAQRLAEEEEAERRRQQQAALYYLSQQGKNK